MSKIKDGGPAFPVDFDFETLEALHNALQRIDTAASCLPTYAVTHEGGLSAFVQNIVEAIVATTNKQQAVQDYIATQKGIGNVTVESSAQQQADAWEACYYELRRVLGDDFPNKSTGQDDAIAAIRLLASRAGGYIATAGVPAQIVAGALYDLFGYMTTMDKPVTFSAAHEAGPAIEVLTAFAEKRGLVLDYPCIHDWSAALSAAPKAPQAEPEPAGWTGCSCRWDSEDIRVKTCERHQGWLDVVQEWAERAKTAEKVLATQPPTQQASAQGEQSPISVGDYFTHDRTEKKFVCRSITQHDYDGMGSLARIEIDPIPTTAQKGHQ